MSALLLTSIARTLPAVNTVTQELPSLELVPPPSPPLLTDRPMLHLAEQSPGTSLLADVARETRHPELYR